jgi:hypothetical protein
MRDGFPAGASEKGARASARTHRHNAAAFYADLLPVVMQLRGRGLSLRAIAAELARRGLRTRHGWPHWSATTVRRMLARAEAAGRSGRPGIALGERPAPLRAAAADDEVDEEDG